MTQIPPVFDPEVQTEKGTEVPTPLFSTVLPRPFIFRKLRSSFVSNIPNSTDPTAGARTDIETNHDGKPDEGALEDDDVDDSGSDTSLHADSGVKEDE